MNIAITVTPATKTGGYLLHNVAVHREADSPAGLERVIGESVRDTMRNIRASGRDIVDYNYVISLEEKKNA